MSVRRNRYYNNPSIGAAFSNLAGMFAPPSASEAFGWQRYAQLKEKRERTASGLAKIEELYGPGAGAAAGALGAPGFAAFPKVDLYNRSIEAEDPRSLDSSVFAVHGNANNTFAGMDDKQAADLEKAIAVEQGKPLTPDQVIAQQMQEALADGSLDPLGVGRTGITGKGVEEILKPDGTVVLAPRGYAVGNEVPRTGNSLSFKNYKTPDGATGTAVFDSNSGTHVDAATGAPLPQGTITGDIEDTADAFGGTTSNETAYNTQQAALDEQSSRLDELEGLVSENPQVAGVSGTILGTAQDVAQSLRDLKTFVLNTGEANDIISPDQVEALAGSFSQDSGYDPAYARFNSLILRLAYGQARLENPSGEVSRYALERQLEQFNPGLFANSGSLQAMIDQGRRDIEIKRGAVENLRGEAAPVGAPASAEPAPNAAPAIRFERDANGNLIQVN
ncbi:hypothetical protein IWQ55_000310 [Labrenzia sp. EL_208]|nr:hypothetical protein [Labrenzia sp. EL_132]MBG6227118.1 hypothetical protein [Labrenzia sp. EL_208]